MQKTCHCEASVHTGCGNPYSPAGITFSAHRTPCIAPGGVPSPRRIHRPHAKGRTPHKRPSFPILQKLSVIIGLNAQGQQVHGPLQIRLLENIGNANFVDALARRGVESAAGGKHHRVAVVVEVLQ